MDEDSNVACAKEMLCQGPHEQTLRQGSCEPYKSLQPLGHRPMNTYPLVSPCKPYNHCKALLGVLLRALSKRERMLSWACICVPPHDPLAFDVQLAWQPAAGATWPPVWTTRLLRVAALLCRCYSAGRGDCSLAQDVRLPTQALRLLSLVLPSLALCLRLIEKALLLMMMLLPLLFLTLLPLLLLLQQLLAMQGLATLVTPTAA
eukprot:scaffold61342_cov21-Tisochrysis_lutea.AAC.1